MMKSNNGSEIKYDGFEVNSYKSISGEGVQVIPKKFSPANSKKFKAVP